MGLHYIVLAFSAHQASAWLPVSKTDSLMALLSVFAALALTESICLEHGRN